jgi:uncharacterized protein (TIGR03435 family)
VRRLHSVIFVLAVGTSFGCGQAVQNPPTFDVAAIHLHKPVPGERSHIVDTNGRFITVNVGLKAIVQWAFDVPASRIVGGPAWMSTERFDIEAKSESALDSRPGSDPIESRLEKRRMVRALLAERFHLIVHSETRDLPVYAMVTAKGGPAFLSTQAKGTTVNQSRGRIQIEGGENTMTVLAECLAEALDRVVIDKSGIQGRYSVSLKWTPDEAAATDPSEPSIFTAIQEQLGLKLDSQRAPVEVMVIDRIDMPTDN